MTNSRLQRHPLAIQWWLTCHNAWRSTPDRRAQSLIHAAALLCLAAIFGLAADQALMRAAGTLWSLWTTRSHWLALAVVAPMAVVMRRVARGIERQLHAGPWSAQPVSRPTRRALRLTATLLIGAAGWLLCVLAALRMAYHAGDALRAGHWQTLLAIAVALAMIAFASAWRAHSSKPSRGNRGRRVESSQPSPLARMARGTVAHVPVWQQAAGRTAWSAGSGAMPGLFGLGLIVPAGAGLAAVGAILLIGIALLRWNRDLAGALSVVPQLSTLAAAQPMSARTIGAACCRYPAITTASTLAFISIALLAGGMPLIVAAAINAAVVGYTLLAYVIAWHFRHAPGRRGPALASASALVILVASGWPPLAPFILLATVIWHGRKALTA